MHSWLFSFTDVTNGNKGAPVYSSLKPERLQTVSHSDHYQQDRYAFQQSICNNSYSVDVSVVYLTLDQHPLLSAHDSLSHHLLQHSARCWDEHVRSSDDRCIEDSASPFFQVVRLTLFCLTTVPSQITVEPTSLTDADVGIIGSLPPQ